MKEIGDLKVSIETYQNITDDKRKDTENSIDKIKETCKREIENLTDDDDTINKLRILKDRSRREESWADIEQNLKVTLSDILIVQNIKNEKAHRLGYKKRSS